MHIKFLAHGTGDPHRAVRYLLAAHDHEGRLRSEVRVLRGNPALVAEVAAGLHTLHRYTSGVIGWAPEDAPTAAEIDEVVNDFERTAFAGLESSQYIWCVVQHIDVDASTHLHILAARVELQSGRALNIAPPGWEKTFYPLRNYWNHKMGWARPDDPSRARALQPGRLRLASSAAVREFTALRREAKELGIHVSDLTEAVAIEPDPKQLITDWALAQIYQGAINNRDDLLGALAKLGSLNRLGKDYISVRLEGHPRPLRLKGIIYGADFDAAAIRARVAEPHELVLAREQPNLSAAAQARKELDAALERRAAYNRKRFPAPSPIATRSATPVTDEPESSPRRIDEEDRHDRDRNALTRRLEQIIRTAKNAVRRFIEACGSAVHSAELLSSAGHLAERASGSADQACKSAERASDAVERAIGAAKRQEQPELSTTSEPGMKEKNTVTSATSSSATQQRR